MTITPQEYEAFVSEITDHLTRTERNLAKLHNALERARGRMDTELGIVRPLDGTNKPPPP